MTKTILVVDDDVFIRQAITRALEMDGYHTVGVRNGKEALTYLNNARADLVLSDIQMPVMDGWSFVRALTGQRRQTRVPVVLMSATDVPESNQSSYPAGFLHKPFTLSALRTLVARFVAPSAEMDCMCAAG